MAVILRAKPEACPERSEGTNKTLHFVQGDTSCQIPRFARNDISDTSVFSVVNT